ncbi:hypothetical protein QYE76_071640 [Lolium multiflorum]|uniref:Bifunctional inhibitor/plant lipid transfer protein/seed storage helical domain-containing protein n=1 Tax=Lolium multiflorum TaxID=4521 RepID=A0AAD8SMM5_LOLMU|nr:hypothetical protein QYE76_071640 [Lolium multiflorum]
MASKTFSAACLLGLLVAANTFVIGDACNSCQHHTPPTPTPSPPPPSPSPPPPAETPPSTTPCPPPPSSSGKCPKDTLKLGACANVLGLISAGIGKAPSGGGDKCCSLLGGLADLEAAVCLCTALKANVLGIVLNVPIKLSLILNYCGKSAPSGFQCA